MGLWRGAVGANRDLVSTLRAARQKVQDRPWISTGWKLVWIDDPRPKRGNKIGCEERYSSFSGWQMGGEVSTWRVKGADPENSQTVGRG